MNMASLTALQLAAGGAGPQYSPIFSTRRGPFKQLGDEPFLRTSGGMHPTNNAFSANSRPCGRMLQQRKQMKRPIR